MPNMDVNRTHIQDKPTPKPKKINWQVIVDNSNRIFDSNFDRYSYVPKKGGSTTYTQLAIVFMIRMLLLPILSTVYVASRLGLIVFNPQAYRHNPAKAGLMLMATLIAVGTFTGVALGTALFSAQSIMSIAGSVGGGAAVIGLVGMVAFASLLHLAKRGAQLMNTQKLNDPASQGSPAYITAPKHHMPYVKVSTLDKVETLQKGVLIDYYKHAKEPPVMESFSALTLKPVLAKFEAIARAKKTNAVSQVMVDDLNAALQAASAAGHNNTAVITAKQALEGAIVDGGKVRLKQSM